MEFRTDKPTPPRQIQADLLLGLIGQYLHSAGLDGDGDGVGDETIQIRDGFLFVSAPDAVQEAVAGLIGALRGKASQRFLVECLLVSADVLSEAAPGWRTSLPHLEDEAFEKTLLDRRSRLLSAVAQSGDWLTTGTRDSQALVSDYEINQTGVIPVTNPVLDVPLAGDWLEARAMPVPGEGRVWLDLSIGRFRLKSSSSKLGVLWGNLDLPVTREALLSLSTLIAEGKPLVAGSLGGGTSDVVVVRLRRQRARGTEAAPQKSGKSVLRVYDASLLLRGEESRSWWRGQDPGRIDEPDAEALIEHIQSLAGGEKIFDGGSAWLEPGPRGRLLLLWASRPIHEKVESLIKGSIRRLSHLAAVDLEFLDLPRDVFVALRARTEDGFLLGRGWRDSIADKAEVKRRVFSLTGVAGEIHAMRRASIHSLVAGLANVSGGTGFAIIERVDPLVRSCGEGTEFRVRVDFLPDSQGARLYLEGVESRLLDVRDVIARFPSLTQAKGGDPSRPLGPESDSGGHMGRVVPIVKELKMNLPHQSVRYLSVHRNLPLDRSVILYSDAGEGEATRMLIGTVRKLR